MADQVVILHIVSDMASLGSTQLGVQLNPDAELGFRMWGGKDASGLISQWLAKDKAARVSVLTVQDQAGGGDTAMYADVTGKIISAATMPAALVPAHNDHTGVQGGVVGERNHLSDAQLEAINTNALSTKYNISAIDWLSNSGDSKFDIVRYEPINNNPPYTPVTFLDTRKLPRSVVDGSYSYRWTGSPPLNWSGNFRYRITFYVPYNATGGLVSFLISPQRMESGVAYGSAFGIHIPYGDWKRIEKEVIAATGGSSGDYAYGSIYKTSYSDTTIVPDWDSDTDTIELQLSRGAAPGFSDDWNESVYVLNVEIEWQ